jgi:hypothetical protein
MKEEPFAMWKPKPEKPQVPAETGPWAVWQPEAVPTAPIERPPEAPQEVSVFDVWDPSKQVLEAERLRQMPLFEGLTEAMVPAQEKGSLYKSSVDPFEAFAPAAGLRPGGPPAEWRPEEWKPGEAPKRKGRKKKGTSILPTAQQVADRLVELYGPDGLRKIYQDVMEYRGEPEFLYRYHSWALEELEDTAPRFEVEHMRLDSDDSELETIAKWLDVPLDDMEAYIDEETEEGWEELNEDVLFPLYYEIVPEAWSLVLPKDFPGSITVGHCDDGCPIWEYSEFPPSDFKTDEETVERLRIAADRWLRSSYGEMERPTPEELLSKEPTEQEFHEEERRKFEAWEETFKEKEPEPPKRKRKKKRS